MFNLLLQVLDEGHMTDGKRSHRGFQKHDYHHDIECRNTPTEGLRQWRGIQCADSTRFRQHRAGQGTCTLHNTKESEQTVRPEFLNRLDEINHSSTSLTAKAIRRIVDIELGILFKRITNMGYHYDKRRSKRISSHPKVTTHNSVHAR